MKKNKIIIVIIFVLVIGGLILLKKSGFSLINEKKSSFINLSNQEFLNKRKNKESFILYVMQDGCQYCVQMKETLNEALKKVDIKIHQINIHDNFNYDQISSTPYLLFFTKGEENKLFRIGGATNDVDQVVQKLEKFKELNKK